MANHKVESGTYEHYQMKCGEKLKGKQNNGVLESTIFDPIMIY